MFKICNNVTNCSEDGAVDGSTMKGQLFVGRLPNWNENDNYLMLMDRSGKLHSFFEGSSFQHGVCNRVVVIKEATINIDITGKGFLLKT